MKMVMVIMHIFRFKPPPHPPSMLLLLTTMLISLRSQNSNFSLAYACSLSDEGLALLRFRDGVFSDPFGAFSNWSDDFGVIDPCSWFGVECLDRHVVALNLKDLCLGGTLAPDLGSLVHIKAIILRNNSFYGLIPKEIGQLKALELLDLGYNNFNGPLPYDISHNLSRAILLMDNNDLFGSISPEIHELKMISEVHVNENQLSSAAERSSCKDRNIVERADAAHRRLLQEPMPKIKNSVPSSSSSLSPSPSPASPSYTPSPSPAPSTIPMSPSPSPESPSYTPSTSPAPSTVPSPELTSPTPAAPPVQGSSKHHRALILSAVIGGPTLLFVLVIVILFTQANKMASVRPWATGLSGQLQKAFVTGVPKLKRSELEAACEDFSNVISSSSIGTVYKGTLSNRVEIAVTSVATASAKDWSNNLEALFRNKIDTLSKLNHKNFVNLLGYCEEDEPFTRMLVFEYAPNGTLFEHLHIKEAEHLDWEMRMRIMMGMAYCLEHMHQLTPPIAHKNLNSSAVNLTEDYAAKVSDFGFTSEVPATVVDHHEMETTNTQSNIYSFGVVLFEMITGRLPYSVGGSSSLEDWASDYLRGEQPLREMVDPTLKSFQVEHLEKIGEVIVSCVHPDPRRRPDMRQVTERLREITGMGPDGAVPKLSPLWWAELEILSTEA